MEGLERELGGGIPGDLEWGFDALLAFVRGNGLLVLSFIVFLWGFCEVS